ncbi:MAG: hypothetical protein ISS78_05305 [Phycisphaerae bacterium]|nr:hypothetical protein [Phycisphaerae bacterium]
MRRLLNFGPWLLGYRGIPYMSRPTFRHEIISTIFLGVGYGILTPEFCQLFAKKTLKAEPWLVAALMAQLALGFLFGAFLGPYFRRRRRIPYIVGGRLIIAVVMLGIALLPPTRQSRIPYVALLLLPALLGAVIINALSSIWHSNYPSEVRGQIFSRRFIIYMSIAAISIKLAGYALDEWAWAHRLIYSVGAACMVASALAIAKVRVRGERGILRSEKAEPVSPLEGFRLLARDREYARFMAWQFLSGSMVLLTLPAIILMLDDRLGVNYAEGTTALVLVPVAVSLLAAPFLGRLFDTVGIMRLRALGAASWATSKVVLFFGIASRSWPLVLAAFVLVGLGKGSGGLAFHIGHTHFTRPKETQVYMGIHMTLAGLRELTMPFLGVWLYLMPQIGTRLLLIAAAIQFVAAIGFTLSPTPKIQNGEPTHQG